MNSLNKSYRFTNTLLKIVKVRKKLIKMNKSYLNKYKCFSIIEKIENYLSINPKPKGLCVFTQKNLDAIIYLIPNNNCKSKFLSELKLIQDEYRESVECISR